MQDLYERVDEALLGRVEVFDEGTTYCVKVTESGVPTTYDFPARDAAEHYAEMERVRLLKK